MDAGAGQTQSMHNSDSAAQVINSLSGLGSNFHTPEMPDMLIGSSSTTQVVPLNNPQAQNKSSE